jgi:uncharacterized membrane protein YjjP (DUF1212 family)
LFSDGGGAGQGLRAWLARRSFNQYGVTALCALVASGVYVLIAMLCTQLGFGTSRHTAGFIASVLFLVPGFPLVGALLDLLQFETVVAISRLAYGVMIALTASVRAQEAETGRAIYLENCAACHGADVVNRG